jgi:ssDNA-binding replication factor A large subunit
VPGASGVSLIAKVVELNMIVSSNASDQQIVAEVLIGDETGTIIMAVKTG